MALAGEATRAIGVGVAAGRRAAARDAGRAVADLTDAFNVRLRAVVDHAVAVIVGAVAGLRGVRALANARTGPDHRAAGPARNAVLHPAAGGRADVPGPARVRVGRLTHRQTIPAGAVRITTARLAGISACDRVAGAALARRSVRAGGAAGAAGMPGGAASGRSAIRIARVLTTVLSPAILGPAIARLHAVSPLADGAVHAVVTPTAALPHVAARGRDHLTGIVPRRRGGGRTRFGECPHE